MTVCCQSSARPFWVALDSLQSRLARCLPGTSVRGERTGSSSDIITTVLLSRRLVELPEAHALRRTTTLKAPGLRVHVFRSEGAAFGRHIQGPAEQQIGPILATGSELSITLDGAYVADLNDSASTIPTHGVLQTPRSAYGSWERRSLLTLSIEWSHAFATSARYCVGGLGPTELAAAREFAEQLEAGQLQGPAATHAVATLCRRLAAAGLDVPVFDPAVLPAPPTLAITLTEQLSTLLTAMHHKPAWIDLEAQLHRSRRQLHRDLTGVGDWLDVQGSGFRDRLRRMRLIYAVWLIGVPGVSVERIAKLVGYSNERALRTAMAQASMPAPTVIRRDLGV